MSCRLNLNVQTCGSDIFFLNLHREGWREKNKGREKGEIGQESEENT